MMGILGHEDHEKEVVGSGGLLLIMSRLLRRESWVGWKVGMAMISYCFFFLFLSFLSSCLLQPSFNLYVAADDSAVYKPPPDFVKEEEEKAKKKKKKAPAKKK